MSGSEGRAEDANGSDPDPPWSALGWLLRPDQALEADARKRLRSREPTFGDFNALLDRVRSNEIRTFEFSICISMSFQISLAARRAGKLMKYIDP